MKLRINQHFILYIFIILIVLRYYRNSDQTYETLNDVALQHARMMIKIGTWDYNFTESEVNSIEELMMKFGGNPVRSILVSSWRSGSSFLGDLLNAVPANFYNYEPLMMYGSIQLRDLDRTTKHIRVLKEMLQCNFMRILRKNGSNKYFTNVKRIRSSVNQIQLNRRLWAVCSLQEESLCYDAPFVSEVCQLFPFQSMKLVRLRLSIIEPILDDKRLNVKVVLLVRDPRAVMHSRSPEKNFCSSPDCSRPSFLCLDMSHDHQEAARLTQKYPGRFTTVRYEDLIFDLQATTQRLLKFLKLAHTTSIDKFLETHTNAEDSRQFSTFRMSKKIPFKWKTTMNFSEVERVQRVCLRAMTVWGYKIAYNASHMASASFDPGYRYH